MRASARPAVSPDGKWVVDAGHHSRRMTTEIQTSDLWLVASDGAASASQTDVDKAPNPA